MSQNNYRFALRLSAIWVATHSMNIRAQTNDLQISPQMMERQQQVDALVNTPFDFYGKVVDENGQPIQGATAKILVMGEVGEAEGQTEHLVQSDQAGLFLLKEVRAYGVIVAVSKAGYYTLPPDEPPGGWGHSLHRPDNFPTANSPAIFPLQKKGVTEPLIVMKTGSAQVAQDGTVAEFDLEKGHKVYGVPGDFEVQTWVDAHETKSNQPYHWKFRITVPGGGLQLRTNEYQFVAPSSGYQASDDVDLTPGVSPWNDVCERNYFVKLADGKYGCIRLSVNAYGSFGIEGGFINPSGSRNLEFDSSKRLNPNAQ